MKTTIRKNKTTITALGGLGIVLIAVLLLAPATQARAETMKYNYSTQITKMEFTVFPDVEGHAVGVLERRGVAMFENEAGIIELWLTFDFIKRQGPWKGYARITFKDGSTFTQALEGVSSAAPDARNLLEGKGKGEYIKGTGRFEGIKGQLSLKGRLITYTEDKSKGDNWVEVAATYTLPKK